MSFYIKFLQLQPFALNLSLVTNPNVRKAGFVFNPFDVVLRAFGAALGTFQQRSDGCATDFPPFFHPATHRHTPSLAQAHTDTCIMVVRSLLSSFAGQSFLW